MPQEMNVSLGEDGELGFLVRAVEKGLKVAIPMKTERYDFIVDAGGRLSRVQVKTTQGGRYGHTKHTITLSSQKGVYTAGQIDFVAAFITPLKLWYIIPASKIDGKHGLSLYPDAQRGLSTYEQYREAWHLLL